MCDSFNTVFICLSDNWEKVLLLDFLFVGYWNAQIMQTRILSTEEKQKSTALWDIYNICT